MANGWQKLHMRTPKAAPVKHIREILQYNPHTPCSRGNLQTITCTTHLGDVKSTEAAGAVAQPRIVPLPCSTHHWTGGCSVEGPPEWPRPACMEKTQLTVRFSITEPWRVSDIPPTHPIGYGLQTQTSPPPPQRLRPTLTVWRSQCEEVAERTSARGRVIGAGRRSCSAGQNGERGEVMEVQRVKHRLQVPAVDSNMTSAGTFQTSSQNGPQATTV